MPQPGSIQYYTDFGDDHGTAVLGVLTAAENNYGMTGIIPMALSYFYPEYATVNGNFQSRSACIAAALTASARGDVVLLEMQEYGFGWTTGDGRFVPAEYDQAVWLVVKTGTDAGKHVVAAAGNGGQNGGVEQLSWVQAQQTVLGIILAPLVRGLICKAGEGVWRH
jgi:subtilisin family serine protease